jgi:hypothetical protein
MRFVQVERHNNAKVYLNVGQVVYFEPSEGGTRIHLADGQTTMLLIHPPEVLAQIFATETGRSA